MLKKIAVVAGLSLVLSGCLLPRVMDANYHSSVDPDFAFTTDKRIAVVVSPQRNPLDSKFYVQTVVNALQQKGFSNTISYKELGSDESKIDIKVVVDVATEIEQKEVEYDIYDDVETGKVTTECTEVKEGKEKKVTCVKSKEKRRKAVGKEFKTVELKKYVFNAQWIDPKSGNLVMSNSVSSYEKGCSDKGMFDFLIEQSVQRLNFTRPNNYKFSVTMPEGYSCHY